MRHCKHAILCLFLISVGFSLFSQNDSTGLRKGLVVLPALYYTPETQLGGGVAGMFYFRTAPESPETRLSNIQVLVSITQNKDIIISFPFEISMKENKHIFRGFGTVFKFPFRFYGIGKETLNDDQEIYNSRILRLKADYLYKLARNTYLGLNYRIDDIQKVTFGDANGILATEQPSGYKGGRSSGLGAIFTYDPRDNIYNSRVGPFISALYTRYDSKLGSDFDFNRVEFDFRQYFPLSQSRVFGYQLVSFNTWGDVPIESLALLGHNTINRGYYQGRFRDKSMTAVQAEYRMPLNRGNTPRELLGFWQRFGLTFFGALGNVAPSFDELDLDGVKYSAGMGLRFLIEKNEDINLRLDVGIGRKGNGGIYFMVGEAF